MENMYIKNVIIYLSGETIKKSMEVIKIKLRKLVIFVRREQLVIEGSTREVSGCWQYLFLAQMVALWVCFLW